MYLSSSLSLTQAYLFHNHPTRIVCAQSENVLSMYGSYFHEGWVTMVLEFMNRGDLQTMVNVHGYGARVWRACVRACVCGARMS